MGFLDAGDKRGGLPGDLLGGELLPGYFLCSRFSCGLLGSSHVSKKMIINIQCNLADIKFQIELIDLERPFSNQICCIVQTIKIMM